MALDDIKKISDEINKLRAELGKRPLKPFDEKDLERAKDELAGLQSQVREMGNDLDYIYKSFKDSVNELSKQDRYLSDSRKSLNGIADISKTIIDYRRGETSLDEKTLQNLKKKASLQFDELQRIKDVGNLNIKNRNEIAKALDDQIIFNDALNKTIDAQKQVNKQIGLVGTSIKGISNALSKAGFGDLSQPLTEAIEKTKNARLQILLNQDAQKELNELVKLQEKNINDLSEKELERLFELENLYSIDKNANKQKIQDLDSQNKLLSTQTSKYANIGKALTDQLTKANLIDFAITQILDALKKSDTQTGQLAKAFGTSYSEANSLRNELNTVANLSGDINITTGALQESLIAVNKEFGTAAMFSGELLTDFTNMTKVIGYTDEAAAKLSKITVATGTDLSDNTAQILGTAAAFNITNDLALNEKEIVEGVAKASAATTVSLGMQTKAISGAVLEAKKLGLELEQVEGIAESLLNFESSISNELEAELLTGRALNLEQARYLALTNDIGGVAKEIARQGITATEFGKMNAIQQKSLAEAVGLTKEELAQSLMTQEALTKINVKDAEAAKEKFDKLVEQYGYEKAVKELGDEKYGQQLKSQSIQDRFNASIEKLKEIFVSLVEPLMPVLDAFSSILKIVGPIAGLVGQMVKGVVILGKYLSPIYLMYKAIQAVQLMQLHTALAKRDVEVFGLTRVKEELAVKEGMNLKEKIQLGYRKTLLFITNQQYRQEVLTSVQKSLQNQLDSLSNKLAKVKLFFTNAEYRTEILKNAQIAIGNLLTRAGNLFKKGGLIYDIGSAAMTAMSSLSAIPVIGWALGLAAAGTAVALGYKFLKGDDVMSPGNKTSGYGERTLFGPEGAIQLNNKDTVIAGTNLFDGGTQPTSPSVSMNMAPLVNEMQAGTNLFGNTAQSTSPSISVNITPLVNEMQAVKAVLVQILNKDSNVYLDGAKVGRGISMASSKIG